MLRVDVTTDTVRYYEWTYFHHPAAASAPLREATERLTPILMTTLVTTLELLAAGPGGRRA